ncbi:5828_t:CDS:2 [Funneliformis caledonium]|uniref:5828_t:CDS:1 n=1 Tax=Funneliformis caledonium TaxID=1117310 RepID=A0A9N9EMZ3_9GLOM|nr:5828_t:CDS:2 [Funneliformis caledonium]
MINILDEPNIIRQTVSSVLKEKQNISKLIEIPVTATIEEAFDVLLAENILSVPVYRFWRGHKQPIAIVNVFDLVAFVCLQTNNNGEECDLSNFDSKSIFLQKPIGELIGLSTESTHLTICHPEDSLIDLLELFTLKQIHRVLVAERRAIEEQDDGEIINEDEVKPCFASQTDVVRFLFHHNHQLGKILDTSASEVSNRAIRLINRGRINLLENPSSITIHDQALTAFRKIHQDGVSAVAVVEDDGRLVGEVSAADLRGLNRERLSDLKKPVIMFLKSCKGALIKPLTCHGKFTLSQVMAGIIRSKVHRAWVVDEDDVPIGVITLSDILSMFFPERDESST